MEDSMFDEFMSKSTKSENNKLFDFELLLLEFMEAEKIKNKQELINTLLAPKYKVDEDVKKRWSYFLENGTTYSEKKEYVNKKTPSKLHSLVDVPSQIKTINTIKDISSEERQSLKNQFLKSQGYSDKEIENLKRRDELKVSVNKRNTPNIFEAQGNTYRTRVLGELKRDNTDRNALRRQYLKSQGYSEEQIKKELDS